MTVTNDNYSEDLNQIRERQAAILDEIDEIKERHTGRELREIELIQQGVFRVINGIDEIRERRDDDHQAEAETTNAIDENRSGDFF